MRRVLFVINDLRVGGAERVFATDAKEFAAKGFEVTLVLLYGSSTDQFALDILGTVHIFELKAKSPFDMHAMSQMRAIVANMRPVTVISTLNDANLFTRTSLLGVRNVRYVRREANGLSMKPWWHRLLDILLDWRTDAVIALSEHMAASIRRSNPWVRRRTHVLPNSVGLPAQVADVSALPVRLLSVGSLSAKKDHATLIRACGVLVRQGLPFALEIIGDGSERANLEELIKKEHLEDTVALRGRYSHEEVLQALRRASIFVLVSQVEGSPNALLEAMAAGLPSVVSDIPSMRETADESCAVFVPAGDENSLATTLSRVCVDPALRVSMGTRARRLVERKFSYNDRHARLMSIVYGYN